MVWVTDGYVAIDDWDKVHLSLGEGSHTHTLVRDRRGVVVVANEVE